jgi:hypothetical protein
MHVIYPQSIAHIFLFVTGKFSKKKSSKIERKKEKKKKKELLSL